MPQLSSGLFCHMFILMVSVLIQDSAAATSITLPILIYSWLSLIKCGHHMEHFTTLHGSRIMQEHLKGS